MPSRVLRTAFLPLAFLACGTFAARDAAAQSTSSFGNRGPASQIGSNTTGSVVGGGTTFGTTNTGSPFGSSGAGTTGLTGQPISSTAGGTANRAGAAGTQRGFVGRGDSAGRFVGNQQIATQNGAQGQQQQFGRNGRTGAAGNFGNRARGGTGAAFGDAAQPGANFGRTTEVRTVRPRQEIAFDFAPRPSTVVASDLANRFDRLPADRPALRGVQVSVDEKGTAVLTGSVANEESKRLAALLARIEPGVRDVRNELVVAPPAATKD
jgi:hypothetical protein